MAHTQSPQGAAASVPLIVALLAQATHFPSPVKNGIMLIAILTTLAMILPLLLKSRAIFFVVLIGSFALGLVWMRDSLKATVATYIPNSPITDKEEAAQHSVRQYFNHLNSLLTAQPDEIDDGAFKGMMLCLSEERAKANILSTMELLDIVPGELQSSNDLLAQIQASGRMAEFVRKFRQNYGTSSSVRVVGTTCEPLKSDSDLYRMGYTYIVYAIVEYTGSYLNSHSIDSMLIEDLYLAASGHGNEHESARDFLFRAFENITEDNYLDVLRHLLGKKVSDIRNDDRWDKIVREVSGSTVKIRSEYLLPGREVVMTAYPMKRANNVPNDMDEWFENPWRIGDMKDSPIRFLSRSLLVPNP